MKEHGCNKLALGHHFDDAVETFMMSLVFEGRLNCFKPVTYMSRADVTQIRPLLYIGEQRSANLAGQLELPVVKSTCPMDHTSKRQFRYCTAKTSCCAWMCFQNPYVLQPLSQMETV